MPLKRFAGRSLLVGLSFSSQYLSKGANSSTWSMDSLDVHASQGDPPQEVCISPMGVFSNSLLSSRPKKYATPENDLTDSGVQQLQGETFVKSPSGCGDGL